MEIWKRFNDKELTHSMAHYLQAVAGLKEEKGHARVGEIADRLGVSKSGVTSMLRSLSSRGLVTHEPYGCVELTDDGKRLARQTESNRQVLTMFLTHILRVPEEIAYEDACMIEHLVGPESMAQFLRLTAFIGSEDPAAERFRTAFHQYQHRCASKAAAKECPVCKHGRCLADTFPGLSDNFAEGAAK
ncbi:MAG: metal-dependent transcriptional regulator [Candidatus Eisenbacteria bacterium]|uniref:Manganese transport regulator n=2 Tax=Eiseniibacteriota bacterium TaxID=2212470 RepID=A0A538SH84_UNCEI|nr:MAG: metal-dependent transcriptional regulator [Candidatus Eisenbacteria bacterium]